MEDFDWWKTWCQPSLAHAGRVRAFERCRPSMNWLLGGLLNRLIMYACWILKFKEFQYKTSSTKGQAEVRRLFDEYLKWGAYPALAYAAEYTKEALLREYFDTMILNDIIQRYNVSKPRQCIHLYHYLLSNISKAHTLQSAFRYLKQCGFSTSRDAVREYIHWAEDSWLLFMVSLFSGSLKEQERNYKKIYAIDWALAAKNSLIWDGSYSRPLENLVFIELYQKWHRVHYYLTKKNDRR
ncbi:MAG: ATP-binding protein [bacterium]|nr:ATP-binding protein [bacterium]